MFYDLKPQPLGSIGIELSLVLGGGGVVVRLRGASGGSDRQHSCNQVAGTGPLIFSCYLNVCRLLVTVSPKIEILWSFPPSQHLLQSAYTNDFETVNIR